MATKAKRHTHKYHRINLSFASVWACALPDCNHYMPQHMASMVEGKNSICWFCGEQFILDSESMKQNKPFCLSCRTGESNETEAPLTDAIEKFLNKS